MKRLWTLSAAFGAGLMWTGFTLAAQPTLSAPAAPQNDTSRNTMAAYFEASDSKKEESSDKDSAKEEKKDDSAAANSSCGCSNSCSSPSCSSEASSSAPSCGSDVGCCSTCDCDCSLGIENCGPFCCCCKPGDPWTLQKELTPCCSDVKYGGWFGAGTYTNNDPLSFHNNDHGSFWDHPNDLNLDQAWFWVEKKAKTDSCCWDWGYRTDLVYGLDAQKTQAFGNPGGPANAHGYDNGWDDGSSYGWALPQAYVEFANAEWDWKVGHFFTPLGYEVIPETGNFFYSHSYTMFNSEPFTHTGALGTYKASDKMLYYVGWTLGWDTGYDQFGNGSNFLGGFTYTESTCAKYTYLCTAGDLGWRGDGYSHSIVADYTLSKKWEYVFQSDLVDTDNTSSGGIGNLSYGANNYLFYSINDCWKWGTRAEWWKSNSVTGNETSFYEVATGPNYKYNANLTIRPEMKFNWCPGETAVENTTGGQFSHEIFGIDALYTF
ncbi:MAG TPA: outer membrane beta-barrel protein [Lacipirellulaceae bacterium]|nr:outer membrane beta-barrel protein [Lacipirellulaceae bacterium]